MSEHYRRRITPRASIAALSLAMVVASACHRDPPECRLPPEPARPLKLDVVEDRRHATDDLASGRRIAEAYAEWAVNHQTGDSSRRNPAVLRVHALNYCEARLTDQIAPVHRLTREQLKALR
jgi:hypothetical protein